MDTRDDDRYLLLLMAVGVSVNGNARICIFASDTEYCGSGGASGPERDGQIQEVDF